MLLNLTGLFVTHSHRQQWRTEADGVCVCAYVYACIYTYMCVRLELYIDNPIYNYPCLRNYPIINDCYALYAQGGISTWQASSSRDHFKAIGACWVINKRVNNTLRNTSWYDWQINRYRILGLDKGAYVLNMVVCVNVCLSVSTYLIFFLYLYECICVVICIRFRVNQLFI